MKGEGGGGSTESLTKDSIVLKCERTEHCQHSPIKAMSHLPESTLVYSGHNYISPL